MIRIKIVMIASIVSLILSGCGNQQSMRESKEIVTKQVQPNSVQENGDVSKLKGSKSGITGLQPLVYKKNTSQQSYTGSEAQQSTESTQVTQTKQTKQTKQDKQSKPPVIQLTREFKNRVIQKTNDQFVVTKFKTKHELISYISEIADVQLAKRFVDHYYFEKNGQLQIIPTEFIPWFQASEPYQIKALSNHKYQLTQQIDSELHGKYTLGITFEKQNGTWKITHVRINNYTI